MVSGDNCDCSSLILLKVTLFRDGSVKLITCSVTLADRYNVGWNPVSSTETVSPIDTLSVSTQ